MHTKTILKSNQLDLFWQPATSQISTMTITPAVQATVQCQLLRQLAEKLLWQRFERPDAPNQRMLATNRLDDQLAAQIQRDMQDLQHPDFSIYFPELQQHCWLNVMLTLQQAPMNDLTQALDAFWQQQSLTTIQHTSIQNTHDVLDLLEQWDASASQQADVIRQKQQPNLQLQGRWGIARREHGLWYILGTAHHQGYVFRIDDWQQLPLDAPCYSANANFGGSQAAIANVTGVMLSQQQILDYSKLALQYHACQVTSSNIKAHAQAALRLGHGEKLMNYLLDEQRQYTNWQPFYA